MNAKNRKGSALLIVLGLLAVMIASAVGFSAFMRHSRLPSSYLRRTSASRQLVKAALARAIDEIDRAIANDPHPGVGARADAGQNVWTDRVFVGGGGGTNSAGTAVSPLCLEALAYAPPPLVDSLRYHSRSAPTARWQSLGFDSGRYSWCALDVSDYFDVNRLVADAPRSSASNRRISLSYLFENEGHTSAGSTAKDWDAFMEKFRGQPDEDTQEFSLSGEYPLVSIADLNLALGRKGKVGPFRSYFCDYLKGETTSLGSTGSTAGDEELARMTFVTDGLFPAGRRQATTPDGEPVYDLGDGQYQPFTFDVLDTAGGSSPSPAGAILGSSMQRVRDWASRLGGVGCAALFDYLDTDHVPLSLALPTTERAPMICGIRPQFEGSSFSVARTFAPEGDENDPMAVEVVSETKNERVVRRTVIYRIESGKFLPAFMGGSVRAVVAFPFAHKDGSDGSFSVDGRFSMFFSTEEMSLRTGNTSDGLHLAAKEIGNSGLDPSTGLMNVKLQEMSLGEFADVSEEEDAVREVECRLAEGVLIGQNFSMEGNELLKVTYEWTQTKQTQTGGMTFTWAPALDQVWPQAGDFVKEVRTGFKAFKADGTPDTEFTDTGLLNLVRGGADSGKDVHLNAAVWLRVKDSDGKVVDMVPACLPDDATQNGVPLGPLGVGGGGAVGAKFAGTPYPLFRFDTGVDFRFSVSGLNALAGNETAMKLAPEGALVADPRWNYAPEHWFQWSGNLTKETWLANNRARDRDGDIFMATSDAGYLQSVYEIAFLPRVTPLSTYGSDPTIGDMTSLEGTSHKTIPADFDNSVNSRFAWRTYDPFELDDKAFENFPRTSAGSGFKVNPYSDSTNVLMAAFANTPIDWAHSSTNIVEGEEYDPKQSASVFNTKYAFNSYSSGGRIAWTDLERIAGRYRDAVRTAGNNHDWKSAWQSLDWLGDENTFCGVELDGNTDNLWTADRKFLYGFWRDCFAARQQLFLVFVRAEPTMMGGEGGGQVPPQLGARAVALVWRDPTRAKDEGSPHQTRVLFYRQFD